MNQNYLEVKGNVIEGVGQVKRRMFGEGLIERDSFERKRFVISRSYGYSSSVAFIVVVDFLVFRGGRRVVGKNTHYIIDRQTDTEEMVEQQK